MRIAVTLVFGFLGVVAGFYSGGYGRVAYMRHFSPHYVSDMDFTILYLAAAGAVIGGAAGVWVGLWLARR